MIIERKSYNLSNMAAQIVFALPQRTLTVASQHGTIILSHGAANGIHVVQTRFLGPAVSTAAWQCTRCVSLMSLLDVGPTNDKVHSRSPTKLTGVYWKINKTSPSQQWSAPRAAAFDALVDVLPSRPGLIGTV